MSAHRMRKQKQNAGNVAQDSKVSEAFFHKTKLCKFFPQGACVKGANCSFAHVQAELLVPPDLYRTRMCMAFIKSGKCKDGNQCKYAHSKVELRTGTVPCNLDAACAMPDDEMFSVGAPATPQAPYHIETPPPSPSYSAGPPLPMPERQLLATGLTAQSRAGLYMFFPVDGSQRGGQMPGQMPGVRMIGPMDGQLIGSVDGLSMSSMGFPVNRGMFFEDRMTMPGSTMKHSMASPSMASTSHTNTEEDLPSYHVSSRRSSFSDTGSHEQQQKEVDAATDSKTEMLFLGKRRSSKDYQEDCLSEASAVSKFDAYLPQINEEHRNDQQNIEEEREHSYCSTEDYLDERQDIFRDNVFSNFNRQFSAPVGFNDLNAEEEDEDAILNDFQKQKWDRQCSAPGRLYNDTFLDLKVGNAPLFHKSTGYSVAIKNTFLDFERPEEINRLRERRPSF